ncbi:uncharacterized protein LOC113555759 [Rhopalosiphum maidis]|uniref:uncharacterized protein LOC113555759 n=1 Tax=Rhopalosiphum maidis TaxID=43146 RepID=UPI000F00361D|nr:uncharacterized protein LOC113555759 [Rhopalosiphum maidis]
MDQRRRKRKNPEPEYLTNVFNGVLAILKSYPPEKFPNDAFTINYIAEIHRSSPVQVDYCHPGDILPTPKLSFKRYEKLISLMAKEVKTQIGIELIMHADIFSISIDSLPDADESAIFIRYVNDDGIPEKRFLDTINKRADNASQIMDILHMVLDKYNLNHNGFMGLSYDIDSNLPRQISDLKSSLKVINKFAEIIPCSSDSLSSVMAKAASTIYEGNTFLTTIDELFNFLLTFKYQWDQIQFLLTNLSDIQNLTNKKMRRYLNRNWSKIVNALFQISENLCFHEKVRIQAYVLLVKVKRLETCILTMFWEDITEQFSRLEDKLHFHVSNEIDYYEILEIYQLLISHLDNYRTDEKFMYYKTRAFQKSKILHFNNQNYMEETQMRFPVNYINDADKFKINAYFSIIDQIQSEFNNRKIIYEDLALKFNFLNKIPELTSSELIEKHENLRQIYDDLTFHIDAECMDLKYLFVKHLSRNNDYPSSIKGVSTFIRQNGFKEHFSQLLKVIKMALCIPATNCPVQQSLSILKKVKTSLGSITNEDTYKSLLLINMEWKFFTSLDFDPVIEDYALTFERE